jgi:hypothetical protein
VNGLSGPLAEQRAMNLFHDAYTKGTKNKEIIALMAQADWMLHTGKTSYEWGELPLSDIQLLIAHYAYKRESYSRDVANGIGLAFNKKKES